jgi:hypothetical protein
MPGVPPGNCAHFVLNSTSLLLISAYCSQSSYLVPNLGWSGPE